MLEKEMFGASGVPGGSAVRQRFLLKKMALFLFRVLSLTSTALLSI
jgi:hypothetical protein